MPAAQHQIDLISKIVKSILLPGSDTKFICLISDVEFYFRGSPCSYMIHVRMDPCELVVIDFESLRHHGPTLWYLHAPFLTTLYSRNLGRLVLRCVDAVVYKRYFQHFEIHRDPQDKHYFSVCVFLHL